MFEKEMNAKNHFFALFIFFVKSFRKSGIIETQLAYTCLQSQDSKPYVFRLKIVSAVESVQQKIIKQLVLAIYSSKYSWIVKSSVSQGAKDFKSPS